MATSSTFSGAAVSSPNNVTIADIITRLQTILSGHDYKSDRWSETVIQSWIEDAIRNYSAQFTRQLTTTITTTTAKTYSLPDNFIAPLSIEYPTDNNPVTYIKQRPTTHKSFTDDNNYAILYNSHATANQIQLSFTPTSAETITVRYEASHEANITLTSEVITIPPEHHDVIFLYCIWQAWMARRETAVSGLTSGSVRITEYTNIQGKVFGAKLDYMTAMSQARKFVKGKSAIVQWDSRNNAQEQIY